MAAIFPARAMPLEGYAALAEPEVSRSMDIIFTACVPPKRPFVSVLLPIVDNEPNVLF